MHIKGRCPSLHTPMEAKDGYLIRLTPPSNVLSSKQLITLAEVAEHHGRGVVQLTSRGNIQIRGLEAKSIQESQQILIEASLSDASAQIEEIRRSILVSPLHSIDPSCAAETSAIAKHLLRALSHCSLLKALPPKFCFGVDGGGYLPSGSVHADIIACFEGKSWRVQCGAQSRLTDASDVTTAMLAYAADCVALRPAKRTAMPRTQSAIAASLKRLIGPLPSAWQGYSAAFGILKSDELRQIAALTREICLLPERAFMTRTTLPLPFLIRNADDPMTRLFACCGTSGCAHAYIDAMQDARYFSVILTANTSLHVSGCLKGCAHPSKTDLTLVGVDGGYAVIENGDSRAAETQQAVDREYVEHLLRSKRETRPIC